MTTRKAAKSAKNAGEKMQPLKPSAIKKSNISSNKPRKETAAEWRKRDEERRALVAATNAEARKTKKKVLEEERRAALLLPPKPTFMKTLVTELSYGTLNVFMTCPHCGSKGTVRTKQVATKSGISGGKATAALLTAGLSVLAVGLSRKQRTTQAKCDTCRNMWHF